jgi:aspartyl aminopeptidase
MKQLLTFLDQSPTPFHAIHTAKKRLLEEGFTPLELQESWSLQANQHYFTTVNNSTIVAWKMTQNPLDGFHIIASHSDSPTLKIKHIPHDKNSPYQKIVFETYGGLIMHTFLDRPLGIAGRVLLRSDDPFQPTTKLYRSNQPLLTIPSVAIHLQPEVNKGIELNKQSDMSAIYALEGEVSLLDHIANELDLNVKDILDFDLYVFDTTEATFIGTENSLISAPKIDNLAMVHASLEAFLEQNEHQKTTLFVTFDNEETGSLSKQGAASNLLRDILQRIVLSHSNKEDALSQTLANSLLISADMAHAVHPNKPELHDPAMQPKINQGIVIKYNANQSYTTDGHSAAIIKALCDHHNIPYQTYANRSDLRGGGTLGSLLMAGISMPSVDVGNPMLAMHSIRETAGSDDHAYMIKLFKAFFAG